MAPALAPLKWDVPLNPGDEVDYTIDFVKVGLLESGETIQSWTITPSSASLAAGLILGSGDYDKALNGSVATLWFSIDPAHVSDSDFDGTGSWLDMEVEITTTNVPPRIRNRTLLLRVCQQ